jgi:hypothetical protein
VGAKSLERNCVEFKRRTDKAAEEIPLAELKASVPKVATR